MVWFVSIYYNSGSKSLESTPRSIRTRAGLWRNGQRVWLRIRRFQVRLLAASIASIFSKIIESETIFGQKLEMPGFEPGTFYMQSKRSTTELHPLHKNLIRQGLSSYVECLETDNYRHRFSNAVKHRWFSGRILACHAGGPGSIPGRCIFPNFIKPFTSFVVSYE
jgi:hypothetical protein